MVKNLSASAGDSGSIPGLGRSPGKGNGNPLQYSCLGNPMDKEPGGLQFMGSQKSQTTEPLNHNNKRCTGRRPLRAEPAPREKAVRVD